MATDPRKLLPGVNSYPSTIAPSPLDTSTSIKLFDCFSLQPSVQEFIKAVEETRPRVIEAEEKNFDRRIISVGYEYERAREDLDSDIKTLQEMGITIYGDQYRLSRLSPLNTNMVRPEEVTEYAGSTFTVLNGQPIELNSNILSSESYYKDRYEELDPEEVERDFAETNKRMRRYEKFGKYLKFLLKTDRYKELKGHSVMIGKKQENCELRKKEMESFQSLTKEQLLAIKSYFEHLSQLSSISRRLSNLFGEKRYLRVADNQRIYELSIQEVLSNDEYSELIAQIQDYISRITSNDEPTMQEAHELVKGEYPIKISRRFLIESIITHIKGYSKEEPKTLKLV